MHRKVNAKSKTKFQSWISANRPLRNSNDDDDSNENGKKGIGLDWHALCAFLAVTARLRRETA